MIRELISRMHIKALEIPGYEADDILGTMSGNARPRATTRSSSPAIGTRSSWRAPHENPLYPQGHFRHRAGGPDYIRETYGVTPAQLIDVKALMGDQSDNIPGIAAGRKDGAKLISQYGTLAEALSKADAEQKGKLRERLMEQRTRPS